MKANFKDKINTAGFDKNPENINRAGHPKGQKNRGTVLSKWLESKVDVNHPETRAKIKVSLEDAVMLALIKKAMGGDVAAIKEIQDTLHGKIKEQTEHSGEITFEPKINLIYNGKETNFKGK